MYQPKDVFENPENYISFLKSKDFEGQWFEQKEIVKPYNKDKARETKEKIKACISAFANYNQEGGLVVLGINDKSKEIVGVDHLSEEQLNSFIKDVLEGLTNHHTKTKLLYLDNQKGEKKAVYLFYTHYSENAICETLGGNPKSWKRTGQQNLELTDMDKQQILRDKRISKWEESVCQQEYEEMLLDKRVMQDFRSSFLEKRDAEGVYSDQEVLFLAKAIRKVQNNCYWTNVGLLFFEQNPQGILAQSKIRFLRFDALLEEEYNPERIDFDRIFYGALPTMIRNIRKFMREGAYLKQYVQRKEGVLTHIDEYPIDVVDELIVNAVVHRDYGLNTYITVSLYKNAFVVENAGRILQAGMQVPTEFNLDTFPLQHYARNPILIDWFLLLRDENNKSFVRALREGTTKIKNILKEQGYPPLEYFSNGSTKVILRKK